MSTTLSARIRLLDDHVALGQQEDGHTVLLDRPEATGGTELGFNGGHLLLLGWGACFKSNMVAACKARDLKIKGLRISLEGDVVSQPNRFSELRMKVDLDVPTDLKTREKLVTIAANSCIVSNTLKSGTDLSISLDREAEDPGS